MAKKGAKSFIDSLVGRPARPPKLAVVTGFEGKSSLRNHRRIYFSLDLQRWVDVHSDCVAHSVSDGGRGWCRSVLWIDVAAMRSRKLKATYGSTTMRSWKGWIAGPVEYPWAEKQARMLERLSMECVPTEPVTNEPLPPSAPTSPRCPRTIPVEYCDPPRFGMLPDFGHFPDIGPLPEFGIPLPQGPGSGDPTP